MRQTAKWKQQRKRGLDVKKTSNTLGGICWVQLVNDKRIKKGAKKPQCFKNFLKNE